MAVDMFLVIKGLKGETKDATYSKEQGMDILAWSWGLSQSGTFHMGGGGGAGKASFQDISVTKWVDAASPNLISKCAKGEHFTDAKLIVRKAGGKQIEYIVIKLSEVMVTSVSTGGSGGEDKLTENISLNFAKFDFIYTPQKKDGSKDSEVNFAYNIAENVAEK